MDNLTIKFKNCYGIGKFEYEFDYSRSNTFLMYAPNGTMKSSLASTFYYFSEEGLEEPRDRFYPERAAVFDIKVDGIDISKKFESRTVSKFGHQLCS